MADRKPDFYDRVQPKVTAFAVELQQRDGLTLDQIANALMSGGVAIAVGVSGRTGTAAALLGIAQRVMDGAYDNAIQIEGPLN